MTAIGSWLLSIIGIVIIGSLIEIILPEGNVTKYVRTIYSLIVVFVIINPIINSSTFDFDLNMQLDELVDENFIAEVNDDRISYLEQSISSLMEMKGLKNIEVQIIANFNENQNKIEYVNVFFNNLVIEEKDKHIDKYQVAEEVILANLNIDKEKIIFYE